MLFWRQASLYTDGIRRGNAYRCPAISKRTGIVIGVETDLFPVVFTKSAVKSLYHGGFGLKLVMWVRRYLLIDTFDTSTCGPVLDCTCHIMG